MLRLRELLAGVADAVVVRGNPASAVTEVRDDSRLVQPGDLFVAVPGTKIDGRLFIEQALQNGARAILAPRGSIGATAESEESKESAGVTWVQVGDVRRALGVVAANRFDAVAGMNLLAVTGTKGKTTTTYLLESILSVAGRRSGVLGTISHRYPGAELSASLTTPGALELHALLADCKRAGCSDVVMEASSIALDQGRLAGCRFRVAALTNVTRDHLDYHGTLERYFDAKAILFRELMAPGGVAVLFADRDDGRRMRVHAAFSALTVATTPGTAAEVRVANRTLDERGILATLDTPSGTLEIRSSLVGNYNLENIALAVGMAFGLGVKPDVIARGVAALRGVPGRLQRVANGGGVLCVVDYAHTPDSLERVLGALRPLTAGRLIAVFGCGGDRDAGKRPVMGEAVARLADLAVITSDNPRTEDPSRIIDMILPGVRDTGARELDAAGLGGASKGFHVEVDRRRAIAVAIAASRKGDTVLLAGKGHEDYQIVGTVKMPFDDRVEAAAAFAAKTQERHS